MKTLAKYLGVLALILAPFWNFGQIVPCNVSLTATTSGNGGCVSDSIMISNPSLAQNNTFTFPGVAANVISGSITITAMGDIDLASEYWTLLSEAGATLTTVGGSGGQCATVYVVTIPLTAADLLAWSGNGSIDFNVNGSADVNTSLCGNDYVQLTLDVCYPVANCAGTDVNLVAVGQGQQTIIMSNDFNAGLGSGWVSTGGSAVGSPCGPSLDGTDYYWASTSTGTPNLTTQSYDVSCGGTLSFDMAYATQGGAAPCEGPDLANEGVTLQYSTDGGATWTVIQYWDPLGGYDPTMTSWNNYSIPIPPGAMGPNTQFQWIQTNSSGTCCDNWGIDNVIITANTNCNSYWYDYDHLAGAPDLPTDMQNVTTTTTFGVWYTNGIDSCYASTTVVVPPGATADAGPDVVLCTGAAGVTIGADPVSPDEGAVYTWSTGATGTIDLTNPGTDNGQITVAPGVTTDYYLDVLFNGCNAYDTVTVTIDVPPTASNPATINVQCIGDVPAPDVTQVTDEADDFTIPPTVTHVGDVSDGLSCPETITRTYRVTDGCGNYVDVDQLIIVNDNTNPTASNPATINVQCIGDVPAANIADVTDEADNCGTPTVAHVGDVSDGLSCPETITRTFSVTDACGNQITVDQLIIVNDNTNPTGTAPANVNVECIGDVPAANVADITDEADNCTAAPTVTHVGDVSDGLSCPETITRTYQITDDCGNSITVDQLIIVDDVTPPTGTAPAAVNVECIGDVPAANIADITDEADNCGVPTVAHVGDVSDGLSCPETITRTYSITDACGNQITVDQIITVNDVTPPTASNLPPMTGTPPPPNVLDVTDEADNCGVPTVAFVSDVSDGGNCPEIITRTYSVTDACGNSINVTQTFTIGDAIMPTASNPAPINVECSADVPAPDPLVVTDEADNGAVPTVTWEDDTSDGLSCPETIDRRYRVTDDCGNFIFVTQTITVMDVTPPIITAPLADLAVSCSADVPAIMDLSWLDNCDGSGMVSGTEVSDGLTCPETITRTWTYTDNCGNTATVQRVITVHDLVAPVIAGVPAALNVECSADVPAMVDLNYTDNCDAPGTVTGSDVSDGLSCPETITRTWTITDACGNTTTETQIITVNDVTPPLATAPVAVNVECIGDVPAVNIADVTGVSDNCTAAPVVVHVGDVSDGLSCPETITRTYSITDDCGNVTTVDQIITVNDVTPPTASNLTPVSVTGIGNVPPVNIADVNDEADNCTANPVVAHVSDISDGGNCPEIITRTYSVTDDCGNQITVTQIITVGDPIAPTASNPVAVNVECAGDVPAPDPLVVTDEADNGGVPVVTWEDDTSDGLSCPETIARRYRVTDNCGNYIFVTQTITIHDVTAPVMNAPPAAVAVQCIGDVPAMTDLGYTDNCDAAGTVTGTDVSDGLSCPETITRSWTYTDACGNVAITATQIITVHDTQAPVIAGVPAAVNVECIGDVPAMVDLSYTDNCDAPGTVTGTDVSDGLSCPETITRTWTYTDACGNTATETQTIVVHDVTAPVFAAPPAAVTVECIGDVPAMTDLGYTDNCDPAGTVTGTDGPLVGGACGGTITRTWAYTDACGNTSTETQIITVDDTTPPTAGTPAVTTVPGGPAPAIDINVVPGVSDNCTANPVVAFVSESSDNNPCPETITRIYSVTDDCGNTINVTHTILITDPIMPTATAPAAINVECIGDVPAADPLVITDEADNQGVPTVAHVGDVSDGLSCPETITRTYSVMDVCGNQILLDQIITVHDVTNPTATAPANVNVECIGDVPAANILDITDEADNCTANPVVDHVGDVSDGLSCPETITRTYSITDDCGNQITVDQLIIVNDVTPPTGSAPANVNVECIGDVPAADITHVFGVSDNCTVNPVVAHVGDVSDGLSCPETITRTYSITDDCGNQITVDQIITVHDVTPPTASNPPIVHVPGAMDVPAPDPTVVTTEADNCTANPVVAWVSDVSDGNVCNLEEITRTYSVTDDCGNQITVTQIIVIDAVPAPIDAGPDQLICIGASANVVATNPWGVPIVWNPLGPDGYVSPTQTTTYTVTADNLGCISTDDVTITVEDLPVVSFLGDNLAGCEPHTVNFTNTSTTSSSLVDCVWDFSDGGSATGCGSVSYTFQNGGLYDVTLTTTSINGCVNSDTYTDYIYVEDFAVAAFTPSQTNMTNIFTEVEFTNNSQNATDYSWDFGDLTQGSTDVSPTHEFPVDEGGSYVVQLIANTPMGCADTAYATISVSEEIIYYIPNTFTPDGDTYNEYFKPIFTSGYDPYDFEILIFNRWGEIIWESHDTSVGWDGTYGAGQKLVEDGTYTWKIEFKTTETDERVSVSGHVNVIR